MAKSRVLRKFFRDKLALVSLLIVSFYVVIFIWSLFVDLAPGTVNTLGATRKGREKMSWLQKYNVSEGNPSNNKFLKPSWTHPLGTDRLGRDIFRRMIVSINIAFKIGIMTSFISIFIGLIVGCISGYFGGWVDVATQWVYTVLSSIPYILLLLLLMAIFKSYQISDVVGIYIAFGLTFWVSVARQIRGEVMRIKQLEYIQAARAIGQSSFVILFRHVAPNTLHIVFVYFSLIFISAVKSEVILSFLGFGIQGMPSWGRMINAAKPEILTGFWWQLIAASLAMFILVYAFNVLTDALQDALDPKHTR